VNEGFGGGTKCGIGIEKAGDDGQPRNFPHLTTVWEVMRI
jgi:hypothetical protein